MRTTLTIDPDVAAMIEKERRERGVPLRDVVNEALRRGLTAAQPAGSAFVTSTVDLGNPLLPTVDDVAEVLDQIEAGATEGGS